MAKYRSSKFSFKQYQEYLRNEGDIIREDRRTKRATRKKSQSSYYKFDPHLLRIIKTLLTAQKARILLLLVLSLGTVCLEIYLPILAKKILEGAIKVNEANVVNNFGAQAIAVVVFATMFSFFGSIRKSELSGMFANSLRDKVLRTVLRLPYLTLGRLSPSYVASTLRSDVSQLGAALTEVVFNGSFSVLRITLAFAVLFYYQWQLAAPMALLILLLLVPYAYFSKVVRARYESSGGDRRRIDSKTGEIISGIRFAREFSQDKKLLLGVRISENLLFRKELDIKRVQSFLDSSWKFVYEGLNLAVIWIGSLYIINGIATIGDVVMFQLYVNIIFPPCWELISSFDNAQESFASGQNVSRIFSGIDENKIASKKSNHLQGVNSIAMRDISFSYDGQPILNDVNLEVRKGAFIALVGPSGSGKSTFIDILTQMIKPDTGSVLVNGVKVSEMSPRIFRKHVKSVHQQGFIFSGTIADNVSLELQPDQEKLKWACKMALIHEEVCAMPAGYNTFVENGMGLSGGQKQRICIARVLYAQPDVLVLDEMSNHLDSRLAQRLMLNIRELYAEKIVISVTHHLETLADSDQVFAIEDAVLKRKHMVTST